MMPSTKKADECEEQPADLKPEDDAEDDEQLLLLKDILDEWVRKKPEGSPVSLAATMRTSEVHDCLEEFEFMCDDAIEKAFEVLGPLCAQFGLRAPLPSKFKAAFLWLNHEHGFFGSGAKKQELQAWAMANANTLRARLVYTVRLYRKTPGRSKRPKIQQLKDILRMWEAEQSNAQGETQNEDEQDASGKEGEGEQEQEMDETGQEGDGEQEKEMDGQEGEDKQEEEMDGPGTGQEEEGVEAQDDPKPAKKGTAARTSDKAAPVQERGRGRGRGGRGAPKGPGSRGGRGRGNSRGRGQTPAGSDEPKEPASKKARTTKPEASQKQGTNPYLDISLEERARLSKLLPKLPRYRVMPYWSRGEVGVVRQALEDQTRSQVLSVATANVRENVYWEELLEPCIKACRALDSGAAFDTVNSEFEIAKVKLSELSKSRA